MTINQDEYKSVVGLANLYYALITKDDSTGYTAGTPKRLSYAAEASGEPKQDSKTQYADNQPFDALYVEGESEYKLKITGLPAETQAEITGRAFDATTGRVYDNGGTPPYVAFGFEAMKSNGKKRFYWFLKGKFSAPKEEAATKSDKAEPKEQELNYTAIKTIATFNLGTITDSVKRVWGDEDTANFSGTNWYTQVQVPAVAAVSALALSTIVPAANATGIAIASTIVLTFNNALAAGEENDILLTTAAGVKVTCVTTIDTARKVVTLTPSGNLTATSTVYLVSYAVKDIYAQSLAGISKFTTVP
jgi:phi13 family phage major tail protein